MPLSIEDVRGIVARVHYDKQFAVAPMDEGYYVQVAYMEPDVHTGEFEVQKGRKWYVSPHATESEVVQTLLTAALASAEHQVREHFAYQPTPTDTPKAIYGPHFSAERLWEICGTPENYDARADPR